MILKVLDYIGVDRQTVDKEDYKNRHILENLGYSKEKNFEDETIIYNLRKTICRTIYIDKQNMLQGLDLSYKIKQFYGYKRMSKKRFKNFVRDLSKRKVIISEDLDLYPN